MKKTKRRKTWWDECPDMVREMFTDFNDITLKDDQAWERLIYRSIQIDAFYGNLPSVRHFTTLAVDELERLAKKRAGL